MMAGVVERMLDRLLSSSPIFDCLLIFYDYCNLCLRDDVFACVYLSASADVVIAALLAVAYHLATHRHHHQHHHSL